MTAGVRATQLCAGCLRPLHVALPGPETLACGTCGKVTPLAAGALAGDRLVACAFCGCAELYRQRDFHQAIGCGIMLVAACVSLVVHWATGGWWWIAVLAAGAAIDGFLYRVLPDRAGCYACHAEFRDAPNLPDIPRYDLHTATRIEYHGPRPAPPAGTA